MNPNLDGLKMSTCGQTYSLGCKKILRERHKFGGECLVNGEELVYAKLVCDVIQKIAVGVVL